MRIAVLEELRRAVAFEGYVWVLTAPLTCVGVDPLADVPGVTDLARTIRLKYATPLNRWTTLTGVAGLGDSAATSPLWREVQQPLGVVDVASAVFRDAHGCWGFLDLWLPEPLQPGPRALLASVLGEVTAALRGAGEFEGHQGTHAVAEEPQSAGPAPVTGGEQFLGDLLDGLRCGIGEPVGPLRGHPLEAER